MTYSQLWHYIYPKDQTLGQVTDDMLQKVHSVMPKWKGDIRLGEPNWKFPGKTIAFVIGSKDECEKYVSTIPEKATLISQKELAQRSGEAEVHLLLDEEVKKASRESNLVVMEGDYVGYVERMIAVTAFARHFDNVVAIYLNENKLSAESTYVGDKTSGFDMVYLRN